MEGRDIIKNLFGTCQKRRTLNLPYGASSAPGERATGRASDDSATGRLVVYGRRHADAHRSATRVPCPGSAQSSATTLWYRVRCLPLTDYTIDPMD